MKSAKLKSSALLIAMIISMVLMILIVGISLIISWQSKTFGQSRDGEIAYRAALSGIEDGLERYEFAKANNTLSNLYGAPIGTYQISSNSRAPRASYALSIGLSSLSVGNPNNLFDLSVEQKANMDDTIDIDLSPYLNLSENHDRVHTIRVYFSNPRSVNEQGAEETINNSFTAMNIKLVDTSATKTAENQLIKEETNTDQKGDKSVMQIDNVDILCPSSEQVKSQCHLRIRPQLAISTISEKAKRIAGANGGEGRFVYLAIDARDSAEPENKIIKNAGDRPGTILITSIGLAGQAKRKLEARVDAGSGSYLGIFDWGVYCGKACDWGTKGI